MNQYENAWLEARKQAEKNGLVVIEHGWEQHVIIDEDRGLVYRYPRHDTGAAKLADEVIILAKLRSLAAWPAAIPELLDYDGTRAVYSHIAGDILDQSKIQQLSEEQISNLGRELGIFLAVLHAVDTSQIERKNWKQSGTLSDYYKNRIELADDSNPWKIPATGELDKLFRRQKHNTPVVMHGDLHGLNIVIEPDGEHLVGIIDLSEIEIGDPHQDFRKLFMTDSRLLAPSLLAYQAYRGIELDPELIKSWAYVNEWANLCYFADDPENGTYQRALNHLKQWNQI